MPRAVIHVAGLGEWQLGSVHLESVVVWAGLGASGVVVAGTVVTGENLLCRSSDQVCLPRSPACLLVTPGVWGQGLHPELLGCSGTPSLCSLTVPAHRILMPMVALPTPTAWVPGDPCRECPGISELGRRQR